VGIDCVGLAIGVTRELGIVDVDHRAYERRPDCITVARMLARHMCRRPDAGRQPGDPLLLAASLIPRHAGSLAEEDDSAFFPYVLVASGFDHALDLTLIDHDQDDHRTKVHWHYVEDRGSGGRAATAIGWVDANEAHDVLRVTRTAGDLGAYDLALVGYL
jgi:hypothetical protein